MTDPGQHAAPPPSYEDVVGGNVPQTTTAYPTAPPQGSAPYPMQQAPYATQPAGGPMQYPYGAPTPPGQYMPVGQMPMQGQYGPPGQYGVPAAQYGGQQGYVHPTVAYNPQAGTVVQGPVNVVTPIDRTRQQQQKKIVMCIFSVVCVIIFIIVITNVLF